jgi:rod shape determining protein RodA
MNKLRHFINLFKNISKPLLLIPVFFFAMSILMMFSTSYDNGIVVSRTVIIQTVAYFLGFVLVIFLANMDYTVLQEFEKPIYIGSILFLLTPYVPYLGVELNGARSWIDLGFTTFQPSEIVKITFVLLVANYLQRNRDKLYTFRSVMMAALYCAPFIVIVLKDDFGSAVVFIIMWIVMLFFAGIDAKLFAKCAGATILCMPVAYRFLDSYQQERITAFIHPDNLSLQGNYQIWMSKVAIGSGGFFGKGLFQGTQKDLNFLPVRNSDFIFAVIVEELGFIGGAALVAAYTWFIYSIARVAYMSKDLYGTLIVMGFLGMFVFQIFENIAMCMGLMPATGITLPFISYGGSSILSSMIALGLIINVAIRNRGVTF